MACNAPASLCVDGVVNDAEIYDSLRWDLMRYATALAGTNDAEDVVSSVVTRVLARRGGLAGLRDPKPYLTRAILNEVRSRHRRKTETPVAEPHSAIAAADAASSAVDVLRRLPPQQRAAAFLVFYQEYTPTEASKLMGCRPATVRRYVHLARRKLQEALRAASSIFWIFR